MSSTSQRSPLLSSEDWVSVWIGFAFLLLALVGVRPDLPGFGWTAEEPLKAFAHGNIHNSLLLAALFLAVSLPGIVLMGGRAASYLAAFPAVYVLAWASQWAAGNATIKYWGLSYVLFALLLGLAISNFGTVPKWISAGVRTEYYIKIGLVILGSNILFDEIMRAGALGVLQAAAVILVVWYACFWISQKLRVDDELAVMLSTAVAICGVSAAIAACGAIQGDRKKLSYVTSLVLIVAAPMMIVMPWAVKALGIPDIVGGAWMGGTIDTSGAVVAAGEIAGEAAMNAAVIVKFSQNAMLGLAAFGLSVWWTLRGSSQTGEKPSARIIWDRFPKFVLGFMIASLVFSFALNADTVAETKGLVKGLRTTWFAMAFVCIGLETRFRDLVAMDEGRPAIAFLAAQAINVAWTLLIAYLLFGGLLFPVPEL